MIELDRHIEILLLDNDCVIVPGLGGFMAHHVDARYDQEEKLFLPPIRTLGFNPQLTMNDSLLAQSYIEAYDISYPEALRRIEDEVDELRQHISNEGVYELNDIGTLTANDEGKMMFEPCESGILTPLLYGLSSYEMKQLNAESDAVSNELIQSDSKGQKAIVIKASWLRNAVAVAAAIICFFFISTPISNSIDSNEKVQNSAIFYSQPTKTVAKAKPVVKAEPAPVTKEESATKAEPETKAEPASKAAPAAKAEPKPEVKPAPKPSRKYAVVLASQVKRSNAEYFVEQLHKKGYPEAQIFVNNNILRVICGEYVSEAEAYAKATLMRDKEDIEDAWVLKVN